MLVNRLTSDSDYFLVQDNFAKVSYDGSSVTYTFDLYGKLMQALIEGADNVKIDLIRTSNPRIKYFTGATPEPIVTGKL